MRHVCPVNDNINVMEVLMHGANPENLYRAFNIEVPEKIFDFSTNTNVFNHDFNFNLNVKELISKYPDPDCRKLKKIISERENISTERILFTNGINEAIFLLADLFRDKKAGILQPCYTEYSRAFRNAQNVFEIERAKNFEIFIIVNPNNPTGVYNKNLARLIEEFSETVFIIDEAYMDFLIHDRPERLLDFENVILLRSLTKFFHLSGARIGYVIADEKIIEALKNFQPSWSVNAVAQALAEKFLNDKEFYENSRNFYKINVPKFMNDLRNSGFEVSDSSVNFFLIKIKNDLEVIKFLLKHGIAVRHTRNFPGLYGKYIRVATRLPEENKFFIETLIQARNLYPDYF